MLCCALLCCVVLQREAQIQFNVSNNQTTGIMDTVRHTAANSLRNLWGSSYSSSSCSCSAQGTITQLRCKHQQHSALLAEQHLAVQPAAAAAAAKVVVLWYYDTWFFLQQQD